MGLDNKSKKIKKSDSNAKRQGYQKKGEVVEEVETIESSNVGDDKNKTEQTFEKPKIGGIGNGIE